MGFAGIRANLGERLPSAAAAIAVQAVLAALLAFSFEIVRQVPAAKETILFLPLRPKVTRAPMVIDGRVKPPPRSSAMPVPPPAAAPAPVAPGDSNALLQQLGETLAGCKPENAGRGCPPLGEGAAQPKDAAPNPPSHVKDEARWQSEIERRNTPPRVPCVSLTSNVMGMDGFAREDHGARLDIGCALKALREGPALLPPVSGTPAPDPGPQHVSDDVFRKALQAVNARKQLLSGRRATAPAGAGGAP